MIGRERLRALLERFKNSLNIPDTVRVSAEDIVAPSGAIIATRFMIDIPVTKYSKMTDTWFAWQNAYKYRKR